MPHVVILMGSKSDEEKVSPCAEILKSLGIDYAFTVSSAHRTPERTEELVRSYEAQGAKVFICAAGMAAHLAGAVAARTTRPVIGIPVSGGGLAGMDALFSTVQMPPGFPVATVALDKAGARNAAWLAAQILAVADVELDRKIAAAVRGCARMWQRRARKSVVNTWHSVEARPLSLYRCRVRSKMRLYASGKGRCKFRRPFSLLSLNVLRPVKAGKGPAACGLGFRKFFSEGGGQFPACKRQRQAETAQDRRARCSPAWRRQAFLQELQQRRAKANLFAPPIRGLDAQPGRETLLCRVHAAVEEQGKTIDGQHMFRQGKGKIRLQVLQAAQCNGRIAAAQNAQFDSVRTENEILRHA